MTVRCAIYTRTATGAGGSNSVEAQRERAGAYIVSRRADGWQVHAECYDDRGTSGLTLERPALRRLIRDARAGKFKMVVVWDVARLSRSQTDLLGIVATLEDAGVSLATLTGDLDTSTPAGRVALNVLRDISGVPLGVRA